MPSTPAHPLFLRHSMLSPCPFLGVSAVPFLHDFPAKEPEFILYSEFRGRDCVVGIATCNGLEGPGIESLWGRDFLHLSRPALWPNQPPVQWVTGVFPGDAAAGAWR